MANKMTMDKLAEMIARSFEETHRYMDRRFDLVDERFERIEADINYLKTEVSYLKLEVRDIKRDVSEIKDQLIPKLEFEDLSARVKYREEKMGIEGGK